LDLEKPDVGTAILLVFKHHEQAYP